MVVGSSSRQRKVNGQAYGQGKFTAMVVIRGILWMFSNEERLEKEVTAARVVIMAKNGLACNNHLGS